jgi:hypothetical protein
MNLPLEEVEQFFRIQQSLMFFVNQRLKVVPEKPATPAEYALLPAATRLKVHQALSDHKELVDAFADENPFQLSAADLEIARSWKHLVTGTFYALRPLQKYMVFLSTTEPVVAYGVHALFEPFEVVMGTQLPRMIKTTLLPFAGKIVYDGIAESYNISFGPGIRRRLNEEYKEAKERVGIVASLPAPASAGKPRLETTKAAGPKRATKAKAAGGATTATAARLAHEKIVRLIDAVCQEHLSPEYAEMCQKMAGILARKRPSPLVRGKPESWASGIVRTIGSANFIGDPTQPHHMRLTDIDQFFNVSEATGSAKMAAIRKLLKVRRFDPEWTLPSRMDQNPMAMMYQLGGLFNALRRGSK